MDVFHAVKTLRNNKPNMVDLLVRDTAGAEKNAVFINQDIVLSFSQYQLGIYSNLGIMAEEAERTTYGLDVQKDNLSLGCLTWSPKHSTCAASDVLFSKLVCSGHFQ